MPVIIIKNAIRKGLKGVDQKLWTSEIKTFEYVLIPFTMKLEGTV